jgi:hypothetical protein
MKESRKKLRLKLPIFLAAAAAALVNSSQQKQ